MISILEMEKLRNIGTKKLAQVTQQQVAESWLCFMFFRYQNPSWKGQQCFLLTSEGSGDFQSLTQEQRGQGGLQSDSARFKCVPC